MLFKYCWCRYTWYYLAKAGTRDCCSCITRPLLGRDSARECYFIIVGVVMWGEDEGGEGAGMLLETMIIPNRSRCETLLHMLQQCLT